MLPLALIIGLATGCSPDLKSYDQLILEGKLESTARREYKTLFTSIGKLVPGENAEPAVLDSVALKRAEEAAAAVVEEMKSFPTTVKSRVALDALSYAAADLAKVPSFSHEAVKNVWRNSLLMPLFSAGESLMISSVNEAAHLQLIKALHRGIGQHATEEFLVFSIPLVGITPSDAVMKICEADTVMFKKIRDLLIYTRSLQKFDPPTWMLSGPWFMALEYEENTLPSSFFAFVPGFVDDVPYLSFKDFNQGEVYAAVYDDPIPEDRTKWNAWLTRADAIMSSLIIDRAFAERVRNCDLSTASTHNFYNDYLLHSDADTTKKEFSISLLRNPVQGSGLTYTGIDSIAVTFSSQQVVQPHPVITVLEASRTLGDAMRDGSFYAGERLKATAYLMPIGEHSDAMVRKYRRDSGIEIEVEEIPVGTK